MRSTLLAAVLLALPVAPRPAHAQPEGYEVFASVSEPVGNIAVSPDGRVFVSIHQFFSPDMRVGEVIPGATPGEASVRPYPPGAWQAAPGADGRGLDSVLGVACDARGVLWMLDNAQRSGGVPRIVAWDTRADGLHRVIPVPAPVSGASMLNDLAVDLTHDAIYVVDMGSAEHPPALIVIDLKTGLARRALHGHESVRAQPGLHMTIDGRTRTASIGLNPVVLDHEGEWLYFGAMSGESLYRVRTADLLDASLPDDELGERVERYADKAISDGVTMDTAGNVYISDLQASGVGVSRADGSYELLFKGPELSWPDAMSVGPDGWVYVAANQLHLSPVLNNGVDETTPPYHVLRFKPLAPAEIGR